MARDFGFAPNPFFGVCTLATCKPQIRSAAVQGDLVLGCGSAANGLAERMIFVMRVDGKMSFQDYWTDPRFQNKKPSMYGGRAHSFGDNIYYREGGNWIQADSHHSFEGGILNIANLNRDTGSDNVLWGTDFTYWGSDAPQIPAIFRNFDGDDIYPSGRGHRSIFSEELVSAFNDWFMQRQPRGQVGRPAAWE